MLTSCPLVVLSYREYNGIKMSTYVPYSTAEADDRIPGAMQHARATLIAAGWPAESPMMFTTVSADADWFGKCI